MNLGVIVRNYLTDNEKEMQQLITWFLNDVMNGKWHSKQEYRDTLDRVQGEPIGMAIGTDPSRPDSENSFSRNRNYERSRLRQKSSKDIPLPRTLL